MYVLNEIVSASRPIMVELWKSKVLMRALRVGREAWWTLSAVNRFLDAFARTLNPGDARLTHDTGGVRVGRGDVPGSAARREAFGAGEVSADANGGGLRGRASVTVEPAVRHTTIVGAKFGCEEGARVSFRAEVA